MFILCHESDLLPFHQSHNSPTAAERYIFCLHLYIYLEFLMVSSENASEMIQLEDLELHVHIMVLK